MSRPMHSARSQTGIDKVVFHAGASDKYLCCIRLKALACLNLGIFCYGEEILKGTYLTAYENKLEYNLPFLCCCCWQFDNTKVIYYDRDLLKGATQAEACTPACTHCSPCPTCFDKCGEGVVLNGGTCCLICPNYRMIPGLEDAELVARAVITARNLAQGRIEGVAPTAPPMDRVNFVPGNKV